MWKGGSVSNGSVLVTMQVPFFWIVILPSLIDRSSLKDGVEHAASSWVGGDDDRLCLGLHLNLSEGKPLVMREGCTLVNDVSGCLFNKFELRERCSRGLIEECDVEAEVRAQIARFSELFGRMPVYLDGHQHVHIIPFVAPIVSRVMAELGIWRTRIPRERVTESLHPWVSSSQLSFFCWVYEASVAALVVFAQRKIRFTDQFVGLSFQGDSFSVERMWQALDKIAPGETVELMTHCGHACTQNHGDEFNASASRDAERIAMMTVQFGARFELVNWNSV